MKIDPKRSIKQYRERRNVEQGKQGGQEQTQAPPVAAKESKRVTHAESSDDDSSSDDDQRKSNTKAQPVEFLKFLSIDKNIKSSQIRRKSSVAYAPHEVEDKDSDSDEEPVV